MSRVSAEVGSAANSYEILAKLAMGGMAEIFLARGASAAGVERYVVLKRVLRERARDASFIRMFLDEARLAAQLQHPNIAQVYDIGKLGDSYFFTMEYVHGETVRALLHRSHALRRPLPIGSVLTIIAGAAAGLHHAHDRKGMDGRPLGIVHRDVSPSNLMVSYEGTVKVVDFGVAKAAHRDTETRSGTVKGKISYMSPEQCRGNEIDRRSDLFSLGIVMWEMLTTERLFRRNSDFENMQAIVNEDIPPPSTLRPDVPRELDQIVMKLLAKSPADRYQTADELHEAIEEAAVRTGSALSAASLGRFVRELFGQRPEPWIELASQERHPEVYTVTSESAELDQLDQRLEAIPRLTQRMTTHDGNTPSAAPRPTLMPTVPLVVHVDNLIAMPPPGDPSPPAPALAAGATVPLRAEPGPPHAAPAAPGYATGPSPALPTPAPGVVHMTPIPMTLPGTAVSGPTALPHTPASGIPVHAHGSASGATALPAAMRPHTPSFTPPSNPGYPVLQAASQSSPSFGSFEPPRTQRRSRVLVILIPAIALGVILGIVFGTGDEERPAPAAGSAAPAKVSLQPGTPEVSTNPGAAPDQASGATTEQPAGDPLAGSARTDVPGSASAGPATTDAGSGSAGPATTDAPPEDAAAKPEHTGAKPKDAGAKPKDARLVVKDPVRDTTRDVLLEPSRASEIETLFKARRFTETVIACHASPKQAAASAVACTIAACKARDASKARRWFASVAASKRPAVVKDCTGLVALESARPTADEQCKRDPLACQH